MNDGWTSSPLESDAPGLGYSSCVGLLLMRPADQLRLALGRLYELVHTECSIK
jgi:hypothetical protein